MRLLILAPRRGAFAAQMDPEAHATDFATRYARATRLWAVVDGLGLDEDERAIIAQAVNPALAGMTAGTVHARHALAN